MTSPGDPRRPLRKLDPARAQRRRTVQVAPAPAAAMIPHRNEPGPAPLSFAQERLWFLEQITPGTPLFNVPVAARLHGPLDVARLERSLAAVVRRHETLRTHFDERGGVPCQIIMPPGEAAARLERVSLPEAGDAAARWRQALAFAEREAHLPFDPKTPPLWRASLLELAPDDHLFVLIAHHGIAEGAGIATCFAELAELYDAAAANRSPILPELPIQYADFATWQRQRAASGAQVARDLEYWRTQLAGLPTLQLPTDRPRPGAPSARGAWQWLELSHEVTSRVADLAQAERATVFMVLLAAYAALLHRYTHQTDLVIGAPISQRDRPELFPLIGFFVNTLVLRADLSGDPTFRELLHRVRGMALDAYAHSEVPFETVVEHVQPDRHTAAHNPMFQVMLEVPTDPMPVLALPGLEPARIMGPLELNTGTSKADLATFMWREGERTIAAIEYDTDLFDADTVERMLANFRTLLEGCLADPDRRLATIPGLDPAERRRVLAEWNDTSVDYRTDACVHQLVAEQVRAQPDALAVASATTALSYAQWNRRANQIAHYLRGKGVGPDVLVGVLMERTPEMVTALLGVLKAGGAYVPLDPVNPAERQALMLEDAGVPVLLTQTSVLAGLPEIQGEILCVDRDHAVLDAQPDTDPEVITTVDHLAYVIFTSGSTGRPKGVQIPHRALLNLLFWHRREYAVTPQDRATQIAGLAFDASVWELWPYLTAGASIHLPHETTRAEPARLLQWLADREITLSFVPTPLAEAMLAEPAPAEMALRALLTGGDKLHRPPPAGLPFALVNHYGPTENAVVATATRVEPMDRPAATNAAPPIGRPIDNVRVYVLDEHLRQPVPIGVAGELCVAGASLARGYHGRPDLTEDRFVPDPFAPGERMYRTGDLVRHAPDGNIEFLGRIDHQVKVRGFRIELGEIEVLLRQHPAVRDAVVLARRDGDEPARLVGYVVPAAGAEPVADGLRAFLQERLPEYMVPSAYVCMAAFPLTANDKIDRQALPRPEREHGLAGGEVAAPENDAQETIAALWRELLGVDQVGIHDNFFDLGGHSMLLVQLHRRLKEAFARELSVAEVFRYPTVAAMAEHLGGGTPAAGDDASDTRAAQRKAGTERQRRRRERRRR